MLAAVMDLVLASGQAQFPGGFAEYSSIAWDLGFRKAREICSESRFMAAAKCQAAGFVCRVYPAQDLERETRAFARRVAGNHPLTLRMTKLQINKAQDAQGFRSLLEDSPGDYGRELAAPPIAPISGTGHHHLRHQAIVRRRGRRPGESARHRRQSP